MSKAHQLKSLTGKNHEIQSILKVVLDGVKKPKIHREKGLGKVTMVVAVDSQAMNLFVSYELHLILKYFMLIVL